MCIDTSRVSSTSVVGMTVTDSSWTPMLAIIRSAAVIPIAALAAAITSFLAPSLADWFYVADSGLESFVVDVSDATLP